MGVLSEVSGTESKHSLVHKGKTYSFSHVTYGVQVAFEKKLFGVAKAAALELRECMTPEQYAAHIKQLNDDYLAGNYSIVSQRALDVLASPKGVLTLASLLADVDEWELITLLRERGKDVAALLTVVLKESFPDAEETGDDSKKK